MLKTTFPLTSKKKLTHDVYELSYSCPEVKKEPLKPGQYVMFQLAPGLNRAYSVASFSDDGFLLIIKRIPDGRGSPLICDASVGTIFSGILPLGHFVLQKSGASKCFIGTGTGFAPLYCQMEACLQIENFESSIGFFFGVRSEQDIFYRSEIQDIGSRFTNFEYIQYISRPESEDERYTKGYVTDGLTEETIKKYQEYYICGSPAMVKSAREKLALLGIEKDRIFFEQY